MEKPEHSNKGGLNKKTNILHIQHTPPAKLTGFLDSNILGLFISQHDELKETVWTEKKNPGKLKYKLQIRQEQVRSRRKVAYDMKQKHPRDPVTVL